MKKIVFLLISIIHFGVRVSEAQLITPTVIASQGDYFSNADGSLSWTLGEIMTETYTTSTIIFTQGFQQPLRTTLVPSVPDVFSLYPNPFHYFINITLSLSDGQLQVFNVLGQYIGNWALYPGKNEIDLNGLAIGMYVATIITSNDGIKKSYKIIKSE
jgi:hypothetical protein